jgi:hypothetical protein
MHAMKGWERAFDACCDSYATTVVTMNPPCSGLKPVVHVMNVMNTTKQITCNEGDKQIDHMS